MIKKLFEKWYQRIELPFLFESSGHRMLKRYCEKAFRKGYECGRISTQPPAAGEEKTK